MKSQLLLTTIAAVVLVGCGESQQTTPEPEAKREPPTAEVLDIDINYAAALGNIEAVKQAIADGADLNAKGDGESTPLHFAALQGHNEIADLLIAKGADVNATDRYGDTPLDEAIDYEKTEIADLLRKHGAKSGVEYSIHNAADKGNIEAVKQHIDAGVDVNAKDDRGETALHRAAWRGYKEKIVELLIANSADVNAKNNDGITPLDWANSTTADLLRKHGGKTGEELEAEESIHAAARLGNIEAVKQQLAAGKDVDARDNQFGDTALHFSAEWGHKEIAEMLIAGSADVNAKNKYGLTPLHRAAFYGHREIVGLIIAAGADVNAKDVDGSTPLDSAKLYEGDSPEDKAARMETTDLLRQHGGKTGEELKAEGK